MTTMKKLFILLFSVTVYFSFGQVTSTFYITDGNDDVNEEISHKPDFNKEFLKFGRTSNNLTLRIGLRYQNVTIPKGAEILSAYIQFTSSHDLDDTVTMRIFGEKSANAAPFENLESEIYSRPVTDAIVMWTTQNWQNFIPGPDQKTPDLKEIIQEIIDQDGWNAGNAMHIKMYKYSFGPDSLLACAYEYMGEFYAPQLQVEYINWSDIAEYPDQSVIRIYPNPATDDIYMLFRNLKKDHYTISVFDLTGKKIMEAFRGMVEKGDHRFQISTKESGLAPGLFFISIDRSGQKITRKVLIN